jgi:hypothetical protein
MEVPVVESSTVFKFIHFQFKVIIYSHYIQSHKPQIGPRTLIHTVVYNKSIMYCTDCEQAYYKHVEKL